MSRCLLVLCVWAFVSLGCKEEAYVDPNINYSPEEVLKEIHYNPEIIYSDSAIVRVIITGPTLFNHTERNRLRKEFADGIRVDFYDDNGNKSSILTAKYAIQYELDGRVVVKDSVVWRSTDGQMLETSELIWEEQQELIYTNKFSVITTPTDTIFTQYFKANQDFSEIKMTSTDGAIIVEDFSQ